MDSPLVVYRKAYCNVGPLDSPQGLIYTTIKEVEGFLKGRGLLEYIGNI